MNRFQRHPEGRRHVGPLPRSLGRRHRVALTAMGAIAVVALAGCGRVAPGPLVAAEIEVDLAVNETQVLARDNIFLKEEITIASGETVVFVNGGLNPHNIIPINASGWGIDEDRFGKRVEYRAKFDAPGTYRYFCDIHGDERSGMIGAVTVQPARA